MLVFFFFYLTKAYVIVMYVEFCFFFFFSSRRRHTRLQGDWSSDVCSSDLGPRGARSLGVRGRDGRRGRRAPRRRDRLARRRIHARAARAVPRGRAVPPHAGAGRRGGDQRVDGARRAPVSPGDRHRDGALRRALGRDRPGPRRRRHAAAGGLLHAVPLGRSARRHGRAAARAIRAGGRPARAPAGAAARGQQRGRAVGPPVRVRPGAARRVPVRRLAGGGVPGAAAGRERACPRARGAARRGGGERELQRRMACGPAHQGRDPRHRLRGRAAPLARPLGAGVGAAARPAPPHHRRGHDGHDDGRDGRASGPGRGRGDADRRGGRGPHHAGGNCRLERRAAARGVDVARAAAAADLRLKRAAIIVLDGVGIGPAPDTAAYGDAGSDTLGNVARAVGGLRLPNLERLGLGWCRPIAGLAPGVSRSDPGREPGAGPAAAYGIAFPQSQGKDSTTGHWEICGVLLERPFRTYPNGFPTSLLDEFAGRTGRGWLGNKAASGTAIIAELGEAHQRTGKWIVYTSADSVFQVAAHEETVPLAELYRACGIARDMLVGEHAVSRVIARPFTGTPGAYRRTAQRKDFSLEPVGTTLLDRLAAAGVPRVGIGKVDDLFAGRNIASEHTPTNGDAYRLIERALADTGTGFIFVNVIEFDQTWGHRNDVPGFHEGLKELDAWIPRLEDRVRGDDLIIITADHGNDPTTPSTDHSREAVPILALGPRLRPRALGERRSFADMGATVAEYFGVAPLAAGTSFLGEIRA